MSTLQFIALWLLFFFSLGFAVYHAIIFAFKYIASHSAFVLHSEKEKNDE